MNEFRRMLKAIHSSMIFGSLFGVMVALTIFYAIAVD